MFVSYTYNANCSLPQLVADIVSLLTDATADLTTLSTCAAANSSINKSVTQGGWTQVYSPSLGTYTLKAPVYDTNQTTPTKFKYLYLSSTTAGYITVYVYDDWNSTTNTGINGTNANGASIYTSVPINTVVSSTIYISSSPRHAILYNDYSSSAGPVGIMERSRVGAWDTPANAFCNTIHLFGITTGQWFMKTPIARDNTVAGGKYTANNYSVNLKTTWSYSNQGYANLFQPVGTKTIDVNGNQVYSMARLSVFPDMAISNEFGDITELCDVWALPLATGNCGDTITANANTYVVLNGGYSLNYTLAVRLG